MQYWLLPRTMSAGVRLFAGVRGGAGKSPRDKVGGGEDPAGAVNVLDEQVDGADALLEACGEVRPFAGGEDAGDDVEGNDPLRRFLVAINGEGDAERAEGGLGGLLAPLQLGRRKVVEP